MLSGAEIHWDYVNECFILSVNKVITSDLHEEADIIPIHWDHFQISFATNC